MIEEQRIRGQEGRPVSEKTCHPELVSGSQYQEMLKQVQHDMVNSRVDFSLPLITGLPRSLRSLAMTKVAFTLAEVLITLGIIGVVAAMTLPAVITKTQNKQLHTAFLKTYSELNQISQRFIVDNGVSISEYFANYGYASYNNSITAMFSKYYNGDSGRLTSDAFGTDDGTGNYVAFYDMHNLNGNKYSGGVNTHGSNSSFFCDASSFKSTPSGALYLFEDFPTQGKNGPVICVDINGKKKPNRYGVDYFMFIFTVDGKVIPVGQQHSANPGVCTNSSGICANFNNVGAEYCSKTSSNIAYNTSCAYYALTNTHPTEAGKDYWKDFLGEVYSR
ncbi:type II secretion system protein [bacterium]|nr:type II secretion system protein [bacterium]